MAQFDMFAMPVAIEPPKPARTPEATSINAVFGEYLEHSVRYYFLDAPAVSDGYYDTLCQTLLTGWAAVTHRYKHMCDESALGATTGFQLPFHQLDQIVWMCRRHPGTPLKDIYGVAP